MPKISEYNNNKTLEADSIQQKHKILNLSNTPFSKSISTLVCLAYEDPYNHQQEKQIHQVIQTLYKADRNL